MPKSRNRKNHKKKVESRKVRLLSQQKKMMEQMETLKQKYVEEMGKQAKESDDSGEVPFTLDG
tara:strand:+ start:321 stop:509 length:189 start_codon:yes stop_codon:yes gene_type:complete